VKDRIFYHGEASSSCEQQRKDLIPLAAVQSLFEEGGGKKLFHEGLKSGS